MTHDTETSAPLSMRGSTELLSQESAGLTLAQIDEQFAAIQKIDDNIKKSKDIAKNAQETAKSASEKKPGWFSGKIATIEALQESGENTAGAVVSLAESQEQLFKHINAMTAAIRKLFFLGVSNMAYTRAVIDKIKTRSSVSNLTEEARKQLLGVISDLEVQDDMYNKVQRLKRDFVDFRKATRESFANERESYQKAESSIASMSDTISLLKTESRESIAGLETDLDTLRADNEKSLGETRSAILSRIAEIETTITPAEVIAGMQRRLRFLSISLITVSVIAVIAVVMGCLAFFLPS